MKSGTAQSVIATILIILTLLVLIILLNNNQTIEESALLVEITNCTIQNGVRYSDDSSPYHLMDVYLPEGNGPFPVILYLHGGGWVGGNRSDFNGTALLYAKRGIAGFSIDYTLAPPNTTAWPQNIQDVVTALSFIKENAQLYRIDPQRIAVLGFSSGAHLGSLVGILEGDESFLTDSYFEDLKSQISLVINYAGVTDFKYIGENWNPSFIYKIITSALGNVTYEQNPNLWIEASPATYISEKGPIFVFIHGNNDYIVPIEITESFNTKLQRVGIETHVIKIDGDHDILTNEEWNLEARYSLDPILKNVFGLNQLHS